MRSMPMRLGEAHESEVRARMRGALCSPGRENRAKRWFSSLFWSKEAENGSEATEKASFWPKPKAEGIKSEAFGRRPRRSEASKAKLLGEGRRLSEAKPGRSEASLPVSIGFGFGFADFEEMPKNVAFWAKKA